MKKIRAIFIIIILFPVLHGCSSEENWIPLFTGYDLTGWEVKAKPDDLNKGYWKVREGNIEANTLGEPDHDYIWLYSAHEYQDFEIKFQFQAFLESPGNSGIQIRSRYDENTYWLNGPQIDIHPPGYWRTGMMWDETRGNQRWIFPEIPEGEWVDSTMALTDHTFYFSGDGIWNEMLVKAEGNRIEAWLNGSKITDYDGEGVLDDAVHQKLNVGQKGYIAFQIHTGDELKIRYREIYIKDLNK